MKPGGQRQVKAPMVLTQKNWQLCCLEEHSSTSAAQRIPAGSGQGPPGLGASQGRHPGDGTRPHAVGGHVRCPCRGQGQSPMVHRWGERDVTSADPAILLQQVASGAGAQEAALGVFAEEGTWRGDLAALVHI